MDTSTRLRTALAAALLPGVCVVVLLLMMFVWKLFRLPPAGEVYAWLIRLYDVHGAVIVGLGAVIEGVVLVNIYLPGSAVILVAVATSRGDPLRAMSMVSVAFIAFLFTAQLNYLIGYHGLHSLILRFGGRHWLERTRKSYEAHGALVLLPSYIHPSVGSFMSVTCGIVQLKWRRFFPLVALAIAIWSTVWGIVAYTLADPVRYVATNPWAVVIALAAWAAGAAAFAGMRR